MFQFDKMRIFSSKFHLEENLQKLPFYLFTIDTWHNDAIERERVSKQILFESPDIFSNWSYINHNVIMRIIKSHEKIR